MLVRHWTRTKNSRPNTNQRCPLFHKKRQEQELAKIQAEQRAAAQAKQKESLISQGNEETSEEQEP